jgi:zinc finger CCCH domain-containing protein 11
MAEAEHLPPGSRGLVDCTFFLTPTGCAKGDECTFRHAADAVGNPVPCRYWGMGTCTNAACRFRHPAQPPAPMMGRGRPFPGGFGGPQAAPPVDRANTPCYWETQPGGCKKGAACQFLHSKTTDADEVDGLSEEEAPAKTAPRITTDAGKRLSAKKPARRIVVADSSKQKREPKRSGSTEKPPSKATDSAASSQPRKKASFGVKSLAELRGSQPKSPAKPKPAARVPKAGAKAGTKAASAKQVATKPAANTAKRKALPVEADEAPAAKKGKNEPASPDIFEDHASDTSTNIPADDLDAEVDALLAD